MATLSDLVEVLAAVEGLDRSSVALNARLVREAGFIKTGGRGGSAAKMSVTDAANLIIAVNASKAVADSAKTVATYGALRMLGHDRARSPSLREVLVMLIEAAGGRKLPAELLDSLDSEARAALQRALDLGNL